MQAKSIAECSKGSILQCFQPSFTYHLSLRSLFCLYLSGCLLQIYCINLFSHSNKLEISFDLKYKNMEKLSFFFLALKLSDSVFILLINVKMPTIVGILTFMSRIIFYAQLS